VDGGKVWYRPRDLDDYHNLHCLEDPWNSTRSAESVQTAPTENPKPGGYVSNTEAETSAEARVSEIEARLRVLVGASART